MQGLTCGTYKWTTKIPETKDDTNVSNKKYNQEELNIYLLEEQKHDTNVTVKVLSVSPKAHWFREATDWGWDNMTHR